MGPSTWNNLPDNLKVDISVNSFKHNIENYSFKEFGDLNQTFIVTLK